MERQILYEEEREIKKKSNVKFISEKSRKRVLKIKYKTAKRTKY